MLEAIQENKEVFSDLFAEVIEDIALAKAIKEGEDTETVSREAIFNILRNNPWMLNSEKALKNIWVKLEIKFCCKEYKQ